MTEGIDISKLNKYNSPALYPINCKGAEFNTGPQAVYLVEDVVQHFQSITSERDNLREAVEKLVFRKDKNDNIETLEAVKFGLKALNSEPKQTEDGNEI